MKKSFVLLFAIAAPALLSGCVNQQQADAKMGKGCQAAVNAMIAPKTLSTIKSTQYADDATEGSLYRRVTITATEKDGWMELDKQYSCLFAQQWGLLKTSHTALLEQLSYNNEILGKKDGKIHGSLDDFIKLNKSADTAMGQ